MGGNNLHGINGLSFQLSSTTPIYNEQLNKCSGKTSYTFSHTERIYPEQFSIQNSVPVYFTDGHCTLIDNSDLTKQVFVYTYNQVIGSEPLVINVQNVSLFTTATLVCTKPSIKQLSLIEVSKPSLFRFNNRFSQFIVRYATDGEYIGNYNFKCTTATKFVASCNCRVNSYVNESNVYCELSASTTYTSLSSTITVNIESITPSLNNGFNNSLVLDNPFQFDGNQIASGTMFYPYRTYAFTENFMLQRDGNLIVSGVTSLGYVQKMIIPTPDTTVYMTKKTASQDAQNYWINWNYNSSLSSNQFAADCLSNYGSSSFITATFTLTSQTLTFPNSIYPDNFDEETGVSFLVLGIQAKYPHNYIYTFSTYKKFYVYTPVSMSSTANGYSYQFSMPKNLYYNSSSSISFGFIVKPGAPQIIFTSPNNNDVSKFRVNSISFENVSPLSFLVTISVNSTKPIVMIEVGTLAENTISGIDLVTSIEDFTNKKFYGVYQKKVSLPRTESVSITVIDYSTARMSLQSDEPYNDNFDFVPQYPSVPSNTILVTDITYFKFNLTTIDLSSGPVNISLQFNVSKSVPDMIPYLVFNELDHLVYPGFYKPDLRMFEIEFQLESSLINADSFVIRDMNEYIVQEIDSDSIASYFNNSNVVKLSITNPNQDNTPTLVTQLSTFTNSTVFGWTMRIVNLLAPFTFGVVEVQAQYDPIPYVINISSSNLDSGDMYNGTYTFAISQAPNCKSQSFQIKNITLYNSNAVRIPFNSINSILGTSYEKFLSIAVTSSITDTVLPYLQSISLPKIVHVGGYDRVVSIKFSTADNPGGSGISTRYNPWVYLTSENGDIFKIESVIESGNGTVMNYIAKDQLPYGFGYRYIFVAISGISDNQNNFNSYSSNQLISFSTSNPPAYYIKREFNLTIPYLEKSSAIGVQGGSLLVYGKAMLGVLAPQSTILKVLIDYQEGDGYLSINTITYKSQVVLQLSGIREIKREYISVQIEVNGVKSNELRVYPVLSSLSPPLPPVIPSTATPTVTPTQTVTETPTPTQTQTVPPTSLCPGNPPCNNRGTCNQHTGCQCQPSWYGPSCSSEIIPMNPPSPQPEPTTGTNITDDNHSEITSMIHITEIREIDDQDNIIKTFTIRNWTLTDLSSVSPNPTYQYTSTLNETTTTIKTTITFFKYETNVTFGSEVLTMNPSSIKFTIEMSSYEFKSQLNLLQIVMESVIKSSNGDTCSSEQYGSAINSKEDIKWIKINIGKTSLYGRFIDYAILDTRVTPIVNKLLDDNQDSRDSLQYRSVRVGVTVPYYSESLFIDPDFSNLVDIEQDEGVEELCKSKSKLSAGAIAGIVVGGVVAISIAITAAIYFSQRKRTNKDNKRVEAKLSAIKRNK